MKTVETQLSFRPTLKTIYDLLAKQINLSPETDQTEDRDSFLDQQLTDTGY